ncbi:MAG: DoxX subfamily protein [Pedosphaera sp.]|nr:DoxX subfamily protein [Pedosphaera sp.]
MKDVHALNHWIKTHGDLALDLVRIYLGIGLMVKAIYFMSHGEYLLQMMSSMGSLWFAPAILMHYVVLAHLFGGLCLTFGLITRAAAAVQLPILVSALFYVHLPQVVASVEARQSLEFAGLVLFLLLLISIYGAGRLSVDYLLARKENDELFHPDPAVGKAA